MSAPQRVPSEYRICSLISRRLAFQDYHTSLTVFLEGLPPVVHSAPRSPTPGSSSATPPPPISPSLMAVHTLALYSFIQLFDAAGLESEIFNRLYSRRLALAKQAALLVRAFRSSGLPIGSLPATCTVSDPIHPGFVFPAHARDSVAGSELVEYSRNIYVGCKP